MRPLRIEILGVPVDCVTMAEAVAVVEEMLAGDQPATVLAVNPEKVMAARRDPEVLAQLRSAGLIIPDGVGVVWAARTLRLGRLERVAGADLMPELCGLAARVGAGIFLLGASEEVSQQAAAVLAERYKDLRIAGRHHGYVSEEEMPLVLAQIRDSGADLLFVALGSPAQEKWMARYLDGLPVKVCQGIGGTLDVLAGAVPRAPEAWRRWSLEWLYRLLSNPRRLLRQTALPRFAFKVLARKLGRRS